MTDSYDELAFPRTDLTLHATRHARDIEDPAIFNHSMRTYLYGPLRPDAERHVVDVGGAVLGVPPWN